MRRRLVVLIMLLALGGVGAGLWCALRPPVGLFLVPDATDVRVLGIDGAQLLTYHAPGPAYAWRAAVERTLLHRGWVNLTWKIPGWPNPIYIYRLEFGLGSLLSRAELNGGPNDARITIQRWVEFPRWDIRWPIVGGDAT